MKFLTHDGLLYFWKKIKSYMDTGLNGKQNNLGYTPVQQGTGIGQVSNSVKIGWSDNSRLKATVDGTDLGNIVFDSNLPASLPANGGNASTVNGYTVNSNVPSGAKFTDTVYTHPSTHPYSMITGTPTSLPANGGNSDTVDGYHVDLGTNNTYGLKPIAMSTFDLVAGSTVMSPGHIYIMYE